MSASPKWVEALIVGAVMAGLQSRRFRRANQEEQQRADAALHARLHQSEQRCNTTLDDAQRLYDYIQQHRGQLAPEVEIPLSDQLTHVIQTLRNTSDYMRSADLAGTVESVRRQVNQALSESRAEAKEAEIRQIAESTARYQASINELSRQLEEMDKDDGAELDEASRRKVLEALNEARAGLKTADATEQEYKLRLVRSALRGHSAAVEAGRARLDQARLAAEETVEKMEQLAAGMEADPNLARWVAPSVAAIRAEVTRARAAFASGAYSGMEQQLSALQETERELVAKADAAQLKADQRDYIADSIHQVLESMGFVTGEITEEHAGHPATAIVFSAVNAQGKGINISVPVDGEVWYDVDGYPKGTENKVGGGTVAVCDEAEAVITEMHTALENEFAVETSDLAWEGKDPDRILRTADELPRSGDDERGDLR